MTLFYRGYVLGILSIAYVLSFTDRQALSLLVTPLKAEFSFTDFEIGLLQGPAFGLFYTFAGLPLGWAADRWNRCRMIAAGIAAWSIATALCGAAGSFTQLFCARVGVGVGEASLQPAALSLIGDYFSPQRRPFAVSFFVVAGTVGAGMAFTLGGAVVGYLTAHPHLALPGIGIIPAWRAVFLIIGLPGLAVSLLALTIREPRRSGAPALVKRVWWREVNAGLGWHMAAVACASVMIYSVLAWLPTYFVRNFGWSVAQFGAAYGPCFTLFGVLGGLVGGWSAARLRVHGRKDAVAITVRRGLTFGPFLVAVGFFVPDPNIAVLAFGASAFGLSFPISVAPTLIYELVPPAVHGRVIALYYVVVGVLGVSLGAPLVGLLTDHVFRQERLVGASLLTVIAFFGTLGVVSSFQCLSAIRRMPSEPPRLVI